MSELYSERGYTDGDVDTNETTNPHLSSIIESRYSRRQALFGGASATALAGMTMIRP